MKKELYIWQSADWPNFKWNEHILNTPLKLAQEQQARLVGMLSALGFDIQNQTTLESITEDIVRSSEIEGELLNRDSVR